MGLVHGRRKEGVEQLRFSGVREIDSWLNVVLDLGVLELEGLAGGMKA